MITVNMNKAKEIKKNLIRLERKTLLEKLDVEFMKAVELGNTALQSEIAIKKQALRDATTDPVIINAQTPEELKDARPAAFNLVK